MDQSEANAITIIETQMAEMNQRIATLEGGAVLLGSADRVLDKRINSLVTAINEAISAIEKGLK